MEAEDPASLSTFSALLVSTASRTEGLLPTAEARRWYEVPWRIFWSRKMWAAAEAQSDSSSSVETGRQTSKDSHSTDLSLDPTVGVTFRMHPFASTVQAVKEAPLAATGHIDTHKPL